jgi:hypothetical protein
MAKLLYPVPRTQRIRGAEKPGQARHFIKDGRCSRFPVASKSFNEPNELKRIIR